LSYEQFFGLSRQPFSNAPDSRFYFQSGPHNDALERIMHAALTMKGLAVMIGDIGTGKTTLARKALEKLEDDSQYVVSLLVVVHSEITASWLLKRLALQLGIENPPDKKEDILPKIYERLLEINDSSKKAVMIIDEANMLKTREIFEEFRGLLNLEIPEKKLLTIVLIGMPELETNIAIDPPLQQRIAVKFTLKNLEKGASIEYIRHRLKVAGAGKEIFTEEALEAVAEYSRGVPRLINTFCDNAMLEAYLMKKDTVERQVVDNVARDFRIEKG